MYHLNLKNTATNFFSKALLLILTLIATISNSITLYAAGADEFKLGTDRFKFDQIDTLVSMGARTLQYFAGGIAVVFLIINGIKPPTCFRTKIYYKQNFKYFT